MTLHNILVGLLYWCFVSVGVSLAFASVMSRHNDHDREEEDRLFCKDNEPPLPR